MKTTVNGNPLLLQLYRMFVAEYQVEFNSPVKLKMKVQIDSLSCNSTLKDELIQLMLPAPFVRNAQLPTFKIKYFKTTHDESAKSYFELHDFKKTMNHFKWNGVRLLKNINENLCSEIAQGQESPSISMSV